MKPSQDAMKLLTRLQAVGDKDKSLTPRGAQAEANEKMQKGTNSQKPEMIERRRSFDMPNERSTAFIADYKKRRAERVM